MNNRSLHSFAVLSAMAMLASGELTKAGYVDTGRRNMIDRDERDRRKRLKKEANRSRKRNR